jgi:hypothetical protein
MISLEELFCSVDNFCQMPLGDRLMLRKRSIIETIIDLDPVSPVYRSSLASCCNRSYQ